MLSSNTSYYTPALLCYCCLLLAISTTQATPTSPTPVSSPAASASSFLDVYLRVQPVDDFCGARQCNITYAISVLAAQNQFDLQSLMLQDGSMTRVAENQNRNVNYFFEDNTVIRLSRELFEDVGGKLYLGVMLFDVPDDIQDYIVVEVTDVVHRDRRAKMDFSSETVSIQVHVYKRNEAVFSNHVHERIEAVDSAEENRSLRRSHHHHHHHVESPQTEGNSVLSSPYSIAPGNTDRNTHTTNNNSTESVDDLSGKECECEAQDCGCCQHVTIRKIHLDDTACVNVSYISKDIGLRLTLSVDNHVYYSKELSVRNPPPVCFAVPHLREYASLCMRLYNLNVTEEAISGCSELEAKLYHIRVAREKIGCFRIPL